MGGGGVEHVTTMSNTNAFAELRWVLTILELFMTIKMQMRKD